MKILHVTYHEGCKISVDYMCEKLGYELQTMRASWNYNISQTLADKIWEENKDFFNSFDCVITSDTAPLSRIFYRDAFVKNLIVWVCNRFDYSDQSTNDCGFPDSGYYEIFKKYSESPKVSVRSYTKFEHEYAFKYRNILWNEETLRPCIEVKEKSRSNNFPDGSNKSETFFITRYHNDNIFMDLKKTCDSLGIKNYRGTYDGPSDLVGIKGIIHIPYAWSNLAIFENWSIGNVYFIPSKNFLLNLSTGRNFFWSPPLDVNLIESSEWYLPEHRDLFVYFDSFDELKNLSNNDELIRSKREKVKNYMKEHNIKVLSQWKKLIEKNKI